jgi:hypothetical protein
MVTAPETDLYLPVKLFLEDLGYEVKSEIGAADVVGRRGEAEIVIVELKRGFSLSLLQQAVKRQRITDVVYVAVPRWSGRSGWRAFRGNLGLCRRLGVGVLTIDVTGNVEVQADPVPFTPRKSKQRRQSMLSEFARRTGDPNLGGSASSDVMTSYRQEALRCALYVAANGPSKGAVVADGANVPHATTMMRNNVYGWFERLGHGVYDLSDSGRSMVGESD